MKIRLIAGTLALALASLAAPRAEPAQPAPTTVKHSVKKSRSRRTHAKRRAHRAKHARTRAAKTAAVRL